MQSPPTEWALGIGYLGVVDYLRSRGEADGDTLSECLRGLVERTPRGELVLGAVLLTGSVWFWHHIVDPLKET